MQQLLVRVSKLCVSPWRFILAVFGSEGRKKRLANFQHLLNRQVRLEQPLSSTGEPRKYMVDQIGLH